MYLSRTRKCIIIRADILFGSARASEPNIRGDDLMPWGDICIHTHIYICIYRVCRSRARDRARNMWASKSFQNAREPTHVHAHTHTHAHAHTHTHTRTRTHTYRRIHTADVETYLFVFWIFAASAALATPMMVISDWFS